MSKDPDKKTESVSNEEQLRKRLKTLSRQRTWMFVGGLLAAASSAGRFMGWVSPDWHVLPNWFGLMAAVLGIVGALYLSPKIEELIRQLPPPAVVGRAAERRRGPSDARFGRLRARARRLLPTWRARILAGALLVGVTLAVYLAVSSHLIFQSRLTTCEDRYREKGTRLSPAAHNRCAHEVAKLWSMPEYCDAFQSTKSGATRADLRARCRSDVAEQLGNLELCKKSGDASETERCLRTLALRAEDASLCARIPDEESAELCLAELAVGAMRSDLCLRVEDESRRGRCIKEIVGNGGDLAQCASIREPQERDACYLGAGAANPGACRKISPDRRAECLKRYPVALDDLDAACEGQAQCLAALGSATASTAPCELISDAEASLRVQCFEAAFELRPWTRDSECARLRLPKLRDDCFSGLGRQVGHAGACLRGARPGDAQGVRARRRKERRQPLPGPRRRGGRDQLCLGVGSGENDRPQRLQASAKAQAEGMRATGGQQPRGGGGQCPLMPGSGGATAAPP